MNKLEKLEIIESAVEWMIFRNIRNSLIHEYPDNEEEIVQGIEVALGVFCEMVSIYHINCEHETKQQFLKVSTNLALLSSRFKERGKCQPTPCNMLT